MSTPEDSLSSFNYFDALFNNSKQNTILLISAMGIITEVNAAFTNCFGYAKEDIIGEHLKILFTEEDQKKGLPENELETVLTTGQANDNNYVVHKNKTITWVSGESVLLKNNKGEIIILKMIQDIHAQKVSEHSILRLHEFNENILGSIDDVVIVLDNKMKLIKSNKAFSKLFKSEPGISKINFADLIKQYDINNDLHQKIQKTIETSVGFLNKEIEIENASGEKRIFDLSCTAIKESNERHLLLVMHDITVHKQSERQREDIIGFVAHELRNPLANIVLCNELMSETIKEKKPDETKELLTRSKNNVMRLNKMIAELYDATKMSSGNLLLEKSDFDFKEMVEEAISTIEVLHPAYNIKVKGNKKIMAYGDKFRLIQVITNYITNGITYSNGSSNIIMTIEHDDKNIIVSVKDQGLGIPKNQLPYVFSRFFRAEKTKNMEGLGLGLYLCQQIISGHNGKVWAESEENKGSTFYFSIPVRPS